MRKQNERISHRVIVSNIDAAVGEIYRCVQTHVDTQSAKMARRYSMREVVDILIAEGSDVDESSEDEEGTDEDSEDISCKLFTLITDLI